MSEAQEADNAAASAAFIVTDTPPQLTVTNVTAPLYAAAGYPFTVSWKVNNVGSGPIGGVTWADTVYLSEDNILDGNDIVVGTLPNSETLAAGGSIIRTHTVTPPQSLRGPFHVFVKTDSDNRVYEYGVEEDNIVGRQGTDGSLLAINILGSNSADLEVTTVSAPVGQLLSGSRVTVDYQVKNAGALATEGGNWTDRLYLSTDQTLDAGDLAVSDVRMTSVLASGAMYGRTLSFELSPSIASGSYYLLLATDVDGTIFESSNDNNMAVAAINVVYAPSDLTVGSVTVPQLAVSGAMSAISYSVTNQGVGATAKSNWQDRFVLSLDDVLGNGDDVSVGTYSHDTALAAGENRSVDTYINIPLTVSSGNCHLFVTADSANAVAEVGSGAEANNTSAAVALQVSRTVADLVVGNVTAPANGAAGGNVDLSFTVTNVGAAATNIGNWTDTVFLVPLSAGTDVAKGRVLAAVGHTGVVLAGESYTVTTQVQLPYDLVGGTYRFVIWTDQAGLARKMWRAPPEEPGGVLWETGTDRRRSFGVKRCGWHRPAAGRGGRSRKIWGLACRL